MPNYIMLNSWTDQGVKAYANTLDRAEAAVQQLATKFGGKLKQIYWTMGAYDVVGVLEAPDDESATAFALALSSLGNVRTSTLRAFDAAEMREIVNKAAS
jgi:uncharacterized protein with GYD domain